MNLKNFTICNYWKRYSKQQYSKYIVQILDSFVHQGPNGQHQCLVFELLGPTVTNVLERHSESYLETETVLHMSVKLLRAITFIHDAGMIHGGNVNLYLPFFGSFLYSLT
jgi:serine/threonine protein kinase